MRTSILTNFLILSTVCFSQTTYQAATFAEADRLERCKNAFAAADKIYKDYAVKNHLPAIAYGIVLDGALVHSGTTGIINLDTKKPAETKSLFRIASMTKSFTAMAIVKLRDAGKLSLSDPAEKYVPEMKNFKPLTKDAGKITIHNLLTMTAGFPEDNPWGDRQLEDTEQELTNFLKQGVSFSSVPGFQFEYSNLGYAILGNIITRVSGMPYQQYITNEILKPLGMNDTQWEYSKIDKGRLAIGYRWEDEQWKEEPMLHDGSYGAMGGLFTSIEDFSKYVALHLAAWPPRDDEDKAPVKRSSVREMQTPFMPRLLAEAKDRYGLVCSVLAGYAYGLGYLQDCKGVVRISHGGGLPGFGSDYRFYPEYGIGVMSFANRTYAGTGATNTRVIDTLLMISGIKPRVLPASDILNKRREQLIPVLTTLNEKPGEEIFAENFFLDKSREARLLHHRKIMGEAGAILSYGPLVAQNQLRGYMIVVGEKKNIRVYFTLSPEANPKIQQLDLEIYGK
jgi:CubicO group peptidase (beta-lactamase class C family)